MGSRRLWRSTSSIRSGHRRQPDIPGSLIEALHHEGQFVAADALAVDANEVTNRFRLTSSAVETGK
jgi:hypothetical protein